MGGIFGGSETGDRAPDRDLRLILDRWGDLPEPIRAGIVAMVKATIDPRPAGTCSDAL